MILDCLKNAHWYFGMGERLARGLRYLQETDLRSLVVGKHEIDGDDVYAIVQDYTTKPAEQGKWEAHRRYIDIQYVVEGAERFGVCPSDRLTILSEDGAKDLILFDRSDEGDFVVLRAGMFAVVAPHDAHMPGLAEVEPRPARKVVVKVRV